MAFQIVASGRNTGRMIKRINGIMGVARNKLMSFQCDNIIDGITIE